MHCSAAGRRSVQVQLRSARRWNKEWLEHEFPALNVVRHSRSCCCCARDDGRNERLTAAQVGLELLRRRCCTTIAVPLPPSPHPQVHPPNHKLNI